MIADRVIFACSIVLATVYFYATAQIPTLDIGDPLGPKAFPNLLGICLLVTSAVLLFEMIKEAAAHRLTAPAARAVRVESRRHFLLIAAVVIWTGIYYAVFEPLGYLISTALYLFALTMWFHRGHVLANALTSVLFSIGSYVLFVKLLTVSLPKGILSF